MRSSLDRDLGLRVGLREDEVGLVIEVIDMVTELGNLLVDTEGIDNGRLPTLTEGLTCRFKFGGALVSGRTSIHGIQELLKLGLDLSLTLLHRLECGLPLLSHALQQGLIHRKGLSSSNDIGNRVGLIAQLNHGLRVTLDDGTLDPIVTADQVRDRLVLCLAIALESLSIEDMTIGLRLDRDELSLLGVLFNPLIEDLELRQGAGYR